MKNMEIIREAKRIVYDERGDGLVPEDRAVISVALMLAHALERQRTEITKAANNDTESIRHGNPIVRRRTVGGIRRVSGADDMGVTHTITADFRETFDDLFCPFCNATLAYNFTSYCPNCGAKMDEREGEEHGEAK